MNLILWIVLLWVMCLLGKWLLGFSAILFWGYAVCVVCFLTDHLYTAGLRPLLNKVREVDARWARGDTVGIWTADPVASVSLLGFSLTLSTTMFGRRGWHFNRVVTTSSGKLGYGVETRYFSISIGRQ